MSDKPNWGELVEGERLREYAPPSVEQDPLMVAYAEGRKDEREEAEQDARRYRHIKKMARVFSLYADGQHTYAMTGEFMRLRGPNLDAAIDAAIQKAEGTT